jgi:hypothetical protein
MHTAYAKTGYDGCTLLATNISQLEGQVNRSLQSFYRRGNISRRLFMHGGGCWFSVRNFIISLANFFFHEVPTPALLTRE